MPRFSLAAAKNLTVAAVTIAARNRRVGPHRNRRCVGSARPHATTCGRGHDRSDDTPTTAVCPKATTAQHSYASARHNADRDAQAAVSRRLSGLPFGGASDYNGPPPTVQHTNAKPTANADPSAHAAATSRLSGLPVGGASDYNGPPP